MSHRIRTTLAAALIAVLPVGLAGCSDEDDDGAVTDEEVGEIADDIEDLSGDVAEELEEGAEELGE